jgi:hypothetical protein
MSFENFRFEFSADRQLFKQTADRSAILPLFDSQLDGFWRLCLWITGGDHHFKIARCRLLSSRLIDFLKTEVSKCEFRFFPLDSLSVPANLEKVFSAESVTDAIPVSKEIERLFRNRVLAEAERGLLVNSSIRSLFDILRGFFTHFSPACLIFFMG